MTLQQATNEVSTAQSPVKIDVRTPGEYSEAHVPGAINVPLADLMGHTDFLKKEFGDRPIELMCRTERRANLARENLVAAGFGNLSIVNGGMSLWLEQGKEVVKGKKGMSLERQVRIAAGTLVVAGAALSVWVHPGFLGLSVFVGCGLVFAGITDTCGMAMMLGKLPFNRVRCPR
jgi:rhodanese-related sulfurtransferase